MNKSYEEQLKDLSMCDWKGEDNKLQQPFQCWQCHSVKGGTEDSLGMKPDRRTQSSGCVFTGGQS